jgi:hypothetical protein
LLGVYFIYLLHFEKNFNGVIVEIGGIQTGVGQQVLDSKRRLR